MARKKTQEAPEDLKPWERQPGETPKQWEAFSLYRDMGADRSIQKVADALGKTKPNLGVWSKANHWVDRVTAWDAEVDRLNRLQQIKDIKKMRKNHATIASAMIVKAAQALNQIPVDEIKASDVSKMVDVASKLERISRGDVGEVIENRDGGQAANAVQIYIPDNGRDRKDDDLDDLEV